MGPLRGGSAGLWSPRGGGNGWAHRTTHPGEVNSAGNFARWNRLPGREPFRPGPRKGQGVFHAPPAVVQGRAGRGPVPFGEEGWGRGTFSLSGRGKVAILARGEKRAERNCEGAHVGRVGVVLRTPFPGGKGNGFALPEGLLSVGFASGW